MSLYKLITKEDHFHVHKLLGVCCLIHYAYRWCMWLRYRDMLFGDDKTVSAVLLMMHLLLNLSSFLFPIPKRKVSSRVVIWEETRWHSLIFASRSILIAWILLYSSNYSTCVYAARSLIIVLTMLCADRATSHYKKQSIIQETDTVMRKLPYPQEGMLSRSVSSIKYFYSTSQIGATLICLFSRNVDRVFTVLFPIQISMFLSTLNKKGIISVSAWHLFYTLSLLMVALSADDLRRSSYSFNIITGIIFYAFAVISRFYYHLDKYIMWAAIIAGGGAIRCLHHQLITQ